ncbi:DUF2382 domain-containing protein [Williamsia maris]|nr:PRC and DUF2382 domain-containing protein [Williamsia maris]
MAGNKNFDAVVGSTVFDSAGDKVGKVEQIYIADDSGQPRWVSVKTGLFGTSKSLVPLAGAKHSLDRLDVAVSKDAIKDAPHLDSDNGTSEAEETTLLEHYGLTTGNSGWTQYGKHTPEPASAGDTAERGATGTESLVRSEERLNVGTQREEAGRARLRKYVVSEEQSVTVPVSHEEVQVVREPITDATAVDSSIGEADAEVTLHADRVVATKETVPVERVGLAVNEVHGEQTVSDTVRKERIDTDGVATTDHDAKRGRK